MAYSSSSKDDDNNTSSSLDSATNKIGRELQYTTIDQFHNLINLSQPLFQSLAIWQKACGDGFEAMANKMRQETSKLTSTRQSY